jgi:hypothetical protein
MPEKKPASVKGRLGLANPKTADKFDQVPDIKKPGLSNRALNGGLPSLGQPPVFIY